MTRRSRPSGNSGSFRRVAARSSIGGRRVVARGVERFFSLLDERLKLGTEGYSAALLAKIEYAGGNEESFDQAAESLRRLAELEISGRHVGRITERLGRQRAAERDRQVEQMQAGQLMPAHPQPPAIAVIHLDAGKVQERAEGGPGVRQPRWSDSKVACFETYAPKADGRDRQPNPPKVFLDPPSVLRLCQEVRQVRNNPATRPTAAQPQALTVEQAGRQTRPARLVRTAVATMAGAAAFGQMVSAEATRRGFYQAARGAVVGDGGNWIGPLGQECFPDWRQILDIVHLVVHLWAAATAAFGGSAKRAWGLYQRLLRAAWSGQTEQMLALLREQLQRLGPPSPNAGADDPRRVVAATLGYVGDNAGRMNYPQYRREGLPVSSAAVESLIKQFNRRIKGSEKFWLRGGAEAVLQVRAAYLSDDGRAEEFHDRRPRGPAVGRNRQKLVA
jgi:hypothetical protein